MMSARKAQAVHVPHPRRGQTHGAEGSLLTCLTLPKSLKRAFRAIFFFTSQRDRPNGQSETTPTSSHVTSLGPTGPFMLLSDCKIHSLTSPCALTVTPSATLRQSPLSIPHHHAPLTRQHSRVLHSRWHRGNTVGSRAHQRSFRHVATVSSRPRQAH